MSPVRAFASIICVAAALGAAEPDTTAQTQGDPGYRIDKPGAITFTVGVKIKGKVEKPQVMIFLPKENTWYRDIAFEHSFREDLLEPPPFEPITE